MRFGICSEIFQEWGDVERSIRYARDIGYDGIEIAPFTLAKHVTDIPSSVRGDIVKWGEAAGLDILGIHWVLVGPEGLHINGPDEAVRERTARYLIDLVQFCGDIGGKRMIFGSPKARDVDPSMTYDDAFAYTVAAFEKALPACEKHDVTICMEPLSSQETNFCRTAEETARLIDTIDHEKFRLLLDTKAMADEESDRPELIKRYKSYLAHYHANDANLRGPGFGDVDFRPIFAALREIGYEGYVSVEVFKFDEGPEEIATRSLEYMKGCLEG